MIDRTIFINARSISAKFNKTATETHDILKNYL